MRKGVILFLFLSFTASAQEKPYFQQALRYLINVRLDDSKHVLHANAAITYTNHSPDTLREIWFHLWPNAYAGQNTALARQLLEEKSLSLYFAEESDLGFIDSLAFTVNESAVRLIIDSTDRDVARLILNEGLLPGDSILIQTPFRVKLPSGKISRLGHIGQAYTISQWYPKPAVYDRNGWHPMPYLHQGEFYSEFGSFDVHITLPANYVVGATGDLINNREEQEFMRRKVQEGTVIPAFFSSKNAIPSDSRFKTLHFHQDRVHDFAWFANKAFHVLQDSLLLPNGDAVTIWALYTDKNAGLWKNATRYAKQAIAFYSDYVGNYPYRQVSVVDGTISAGAGMEYPNVTIIGNVSSARELDITIAHEIGHNWFYGMLASNERSHPWMDEGMNSFVELQYEKHHYPEIGEFDHLGFPKKVGELLGTAQLSNDAVKLEEFRFSALRRSDQSLALPAPEYTKINYASGVYVKSSIAFEQLSHLIGEERMKSAMRHYFADWAFKHPQPGDVRNSFESSSGMDLSWLFDGALGSNQRLDYGIRSFRDKDGKLFARIHQQGEYAAPIPVIAFHEGKPIYREWVNTQAKDTSIAIPCDSCDHLRIDPAHVSLDINYLNNTTRTTGIFKTLEPISLRFLTHSEHRPATQLFWLPAIGWNNYNKGMIGFTLHNYYPISKRFEFAVTPFYTAAGLAGMGKINHHHFLKKGIFTSISTSLAFQRFSYSNAQLIEQGNPFDFDQLHYMRGEPALQFNIRAGNPRSNSKEFIRLSAILLWEDQVTTNIAEKKDHLYRNIDRQLYRAEWRLTNKRAIDPFSIQLLSEGNADYLRISSTLNYRFNYKKAGKGFDARLFGASLVEGNLDNGIGITLTDRRAGNGTNDYAYDELYLGRSETEGILWQQMAEREGAMKAYSLLNSSTYKWGVALNLRADIPVGIPLAVFADIATADNLKEQFKLAYQLEQSTTWDAGLCFSILPNVLTIYAPLLFSDDIKAYNDFEDLSFKERIRFTLNIRNLDPVRIRDRYLD